MDIFGEFEGVGEFFIDRSKVFVMVILWGEEFDEGGFFGFEDDFVEVVRDKVEDGRFGCDNSCEVGEYEVFEENYGGDVVLWWFVGWVF